MVSEIDIMYKKFKDCNGAVFINDNLRTGGGYFDVKHGGLTITLKGAKPFKSLPGQNPYFLIEISGKSSLEEKIKTFIHELLHINPPFSQYLDRLMLIDFPDSDYKKIESDIEQWTQELFTSPYEVDAIDWLGTIIREAEQIKPQHYFVP